MSVESAKEKGKIFSRTLVDICFAGATVLGGIFAAYAAARLNGEPFGFYTWPFVVCVVLFLFTTVGFFTTQKGTEALYLICSAASAACGLVQLAILF